MLTLFAQYYVPKTLKRSEEINLCFKKNIENKLVKNFVILFEKEDDMKLIPDHKKIVKKFLPDRMTYSNWLKETESLKPGTLSILINSDIYLTDSIDHLLEHSKQMMDEKKFLALSRYNPTVDGYELNSNPHWTQDTWGIVKGQEKLPVALLQETAFELGHPGCDNKIAYVMHSYGYSITNPCTKVCTIHLQEDAAREYDSKASKLLGLHAFVHPTNSVLENSILEFDLLTRSGCDPVEIRVNNWINSRKTYDLIADGKPSQPIKLINKEAAQDLKITKTYAEIEHANTKLASRKIISAKDFNPSGYELIAKFSDRFLVYSDGENLYYQDRYWPVVISQVKSELGDIELDQSSAVLFSEAFLPIVLEVESSEISVDMQYPEDIMFWQFPCRTEGDAYDVHKAIKNRSYQTNVVNVYLPLPWATFIDKKKFPVAHLQILGRRISAAKQILKKFGYSLKVHTVCQHIRWRNIEEWLPKLGITDLWISHKEKGLDDFAGVKLHPWTLYAVNYRDKSRSKGLAFKPVDQKKTFASFIGAHMKHYPTDVRLRLNDLKDLPGYVIEIKDLWHFNKVVYNYQVFGQEKEKHSIQVDDVERYNEVISDSIFSLCPAGAGPNTLRLWESLAVGAIPVVLSDSYDTKLFVNEHGDDCCDFIVIHDEGDMSNLDSTLRKYSNEELVEMQNKGIQYYRKTIGMNVFDSNA